MIAMARVTAACAATTHDTSNAVRHGPVSVNGEEATYPTPDALVPRPGRSLELYELSDAAHAGATHSNDVRDN